MKELLIVGVDVSKATLDICIMPQNTSLRIVNTDSGFKQLISALQPSLHADTSVLVVMEHTGQYSHRFEQFLQTQAIGYCKLSALSIKRSLGLIRGKADKIDARRIAGYAWLRREILTADRPCLVCIQELRQWMQLRSQLVKECSGYKNRLKEMIDTGSCCKTHPLVRLQQAHIKGIRQRIAEVEKYIKALLATHAALQKSCELLMTIKGVGWVIATYMICCTQNFERFGSARKFNCYAGLAPFKQESGTSLRGRSRVSHLANKEAKTLLNLAAFSAMRCDAELKAYYQRRVAEGKRKLSCVNIIRAKIVARMFAVIKRQTPYVILPTAA